jgi:hypothetical protein
MVPETRTGRVDSWMCFPKGMAPNPTGVYAFCQLEDWPKSTTYSDPLRDGNLYAFVLEVQVILEGVSIDLMARALGGIFYQEAVEIVALLSRADSFYLLKTRQDLLSKGTDVEIFPQHVRERRFALNSEQTSRRLVKPPKLGGMEPGGGKDAFEWARDMFADFGSRIISFDTTREASDVIIEGTSRLQMGHPASGIGMPPENAEVALAQRVVTSSVILRVPPMEAGVASIGPATETSNVDAPHPDAIVDRPTRRANVADGELPRRKCVNVVKPL